MSDEHKHDRTVYSRESNATGWFVGIIMALSLLAIAYLVYSANSQPSAPKEGMEYPPILEPLVGSSVVAAREQALILEKPDGTCVALESVTYREMWHQPVECPSATDTPSP